MNMTYQIIDDHKVYLLARHVLTYIYIVNINKQVTKLHKCLTKTVIYLILYYFYDLMGLPKSGKVLLSL